MEQTWRWFGPDDVIRLAHIRQAGATGIVTALHHIPYGVVWSVEEIEKRKAMIAAEPSLGLRWSVVESLPVHEAIKIGEGDLDPLFDNYRQSLRNLAACGVATVCYNFMPVLDWTRTDCPSAPRRRPGAAIQRARIRRLRLLHAGAPGRRGRAHPAEVVDRARTWFGRASESDKRTLLATIMAGLPGAFDRYDIPGLRRMLDRYREMTRARLRENLARFLREVIPTAEEIGIRMASTPTTRRAPSWACRGSSRTPTILPSSSRPSTRPPNGITLCSGSLGAGADNDVPAIARALRRARSISRICATSRRSRTARSWRPTTSAATRTWLRWSRTLLDEQKRRRDAGDPRWRIPMRPDHGHELLDDIGKATHPGYPMIGRLKGLAELRGVMQALAAIRGLPL